MSPCARQLIPSLASLPGDVARRFGPADEEIARIAGILNDSRKVTIFGGAGCADAHNELIELAGKLKAPIVHALRGKEFIEYDNPFDVGMTGLLGFSSGYRAMMDCDTLLMLGTDFPYQQFYPEKATIIQVDIRGEQIGRRTKVDLGVVGDVKTTLRTLLPNLTEKTDDQHLSASIQHYQKARKELDDLAVGETRPEIYSSAVCRKSDRRTRSEGRDLYLRRRHAHHLGSALPYDEW